MEQKRPLVAVVALALLALGCGAAPVYDGGFAAPAGVPAPDPTAPGLPAPPAPDTKGAPPEPASCGCTPAPAARTP